MKLDTTGASPDLAAAPEGRKDDTEKLPMDLVPYDAVEEVARVLAFGAKKYAPRNWEKGMAWSRLLAAALRHMARVAIGERLDPDSGLPHLAHTACDILFLLAYMRRGVGTDDLLGGPESK